MQRSKRDHCIGIRLRHIEYEMVPGHMAWGITGERLSWTRRITVGRFSWSGAAESCRHATSRLRVALSVTSDCIIGQPAGLTAPGHRNPSVRLSVCLSVCLFVWTYMSVCLSRAVVHEKSPLSVQTPPPPPADSRPSVTFIRLSHTGPGYRRKQKRKFRTS